jgi:hypothetical protein
VIAGAGALGRVEAGRLVRNPALWLGFAPSGLWLHAAFATDNTEDHYNVLIGYPLVVPGLVMLFHVGLATLRGRMSGTEELFETVPVGRDRRTVGHGVSTVASGLLGLAFVVVALVVLRPSSPIGQISGLRRADPLDFERFDVPRPNVAQLLQGPLAVVVVCCLTIALVRWVPSWVVLLVMTFLALVQLTFAGLWFGTARTSVVEWLGLLPVGLVHSEWVGCGPDDPICELVMSGYDRATPWWHAGYLVALALWFVSIAVLRHRRDRVAWITFGGALTAVVAFGVAQYLVFEQYTLPVPA